MTMPAWITLDSANNRLIGAAGTFTGQTQAQANATAQAALDTWANAEILAGHLFCASSISCVAPLTTIATGTNNDLVESTDPAVRFLVSWDASNLWFVDTNTNTVVNTVGTAFAYNEGCYAENVQNFCLGRTTGGGHLIDFFTTGGTLVHTLDLAPFNPGFGITTDLTYEPNTGKIYVIGEAFANAVMLTIDPSTYAVTSTPLAVDSYAGTPMRSIPGHVYFMDAPNENLFDYLVPGLTLNGTITNTGSFSGGVAFATNTSKLYLGAFNAITFDSEIWEVNPATESIDFVYAVASIGSPDAIFYDPTQQRLVALEVTGGNGVVLDPSGRTVVCTFDVSILNAILGLDTASGNCYITDRPNNQLIVYH